MATQPTEWQPPEVESMPLAALAARYVQRVDPDWFMEDSIYDKVVTAHGFDPLQDK